MKKIAFLVTVSLAACIAQASFWWPFGSDAEKEDAPRISELMEPASLLIDEASDLAAEGKSNESVAKYREALRELDRIEMENPERVKSQEFATLRNKRAYVNAAIDSMLLGQVRDNARAVAVSDTTELEKKLAEERQQKKQATEKPEAAQGEGAQEAEAEEPKETAGKPPKEQKNAAKPVVSERDQAISAIASGDYETADMIIGAMLTENPKSEMALNLKASLEAKRGRLADAELALDQAIKASPKSFYAYYNMARLKLQSGPDGKSAAKRYYETGRAFGGPSDAALEAAIR